MRRAVRIIGLSSLFLVACQFPPTAQKPAEAPVTGTGAINDTIPDRLEEDIEADLTENLPQKTIEERLLPGGILEIGSSDAPVALLLFTNHACRYCQDFHQTLLPVLFADYVYAGKLRIDLVPFGMKKYQDSESSATAAYCAAMQGKGLPLHDLLFSTR